MPINEGGILMVRNAHLAILATAAIVFASSAATAGSLNSYNSSNTPVVSYTAQPEPVMLAPAYAPAAPAPEVQRDGFYDPSKGNNDDFGYKQSHACGGALDGATCLVILNDHMRRVRLERDAGTILVGNPTIADVTVLGKDTIFVSARSIGATNIIVLDEDNNEIRTFEVFVREPTTKRVVLRNAGLPENYQCAPNCLRALTQSDSPASHSTTAGVIQTDIGLDQTAIGLQSGVNPNQDPGAIAPVAPPAPAGSAGPAAGPAAAALGALLGGGAPTAPVISTAPPPVAN
jgi:hypothetical protein